MKNVNRLLDKAYRRYCYGDEHCYIMTCPLNALMINVTIHTKTNNLLLLYGDYKLLEKMGT